MSGLFVFDAYGTLFDVNAAVARHRDLVGPMADRLSELWRLKQLEYSWVRSLMGRHRDFWTLTLEALDHAAALIGGISPDARAALASAYETLDAYPDAAEVLTQLRLRGARTAILSNGTPAMLASACHAAGLSNLLDAVLSIEDAGIYKTDLRTYGLVMQRFAVTPGAVTFVSSNRWDVAGASAFGFSCRWVNRAGRPDEYTDLPPAEVIGNLRELIV